MRPKSIETEFKSNQNQFRNQSIENGTKLVRTSGVLLANLYVIDGGAVAIDGRRQVQVGQVQVQIMSDRTANVPHTSRVRVVRRRVVRRHNDSIGSDDASSTNG